MLGDIRKRQRVRKWLFSRVTIGALFLLVVLVGQGVWGVYKKDRDTTIRLQTTKERYEELEERKVFLESEIERLSTEEGVEEEIRERYGFAKEGERVIVVIEGEDTDTSSAATHESGFWSWLKDLFR